MQHLIVDIVDETEILTEKQLSLVDHLIQFVATKETVDAGAEVSVSFVTNDAIQTLNNEYRGKDTPTDVLSFAMEEVHEEEIEVVLDEEMPLILGDIIISVDKIKEQAEAYAHSFERELGFLLVHGFLHLLGYDHIDAEQERSMFARQTTLLDEYGLIR